MSDKADGKEKNMPDKYIPDEEIDAEIARLRQSADVRLAEKRGQKLRESGITGETLDNAYGGDRYAAD